MIFPSELLIWFQHLFFCVLVCFVCVNVYSQEMNKNFGNIWRLLFALLIEMYFKIQVFRPVSRHFGYVHGRPQTFFQGGQKHTLFLKNILHFSKKPTKHTIFGRPGGQKPPLPPSGRPWVCATSFHSIILYTLAHVKWKKKLWNIWWLLFQ